MVKTKDLEDMIALRQGMQNKLMVESREKKKET